MKKKSKGKNITVSEKAHDMMLDQSSKKPRKSIRAIINLKFNLPENE